MRLLRFIVPLSAAIICFATYFVLRRQPDLIDGDLRELFFGSRLQYIRFLLAAAVIFLAVRLFDFVVFDLIFSRRRRMVVPVLLRQIVSFGLYLLLFASAISIVFDKDITGLAISGTVLAAVLGLALQDTLGNLFSGMSLHIEQTFGVGDVIRSGELVGVVEAVNWRATRLRSFNNNIVVIPNSVVARERIEVYPRANLNARLVTVGIAYHVPPAEAISVLEHAAANVEGVAGEIPCLARVGGFGDSSVTYEIKYWTRSYHQRNMIDASIRRAVWYALKRNNMPIPFPIRSLHRYGDPGKRAHIPVDTIVTRLEAVEIFSPLSDEERRSIAAGANVLFFSRGETIIRKGEEGDSMFVIHSGTISVRLPEAAGRFKEIAQLGDGNIFGEMALLTGESRFADVIALTDVTTMEIEKEDIQPVLQENPDLAALMAERITLNRSAASSIPQMAAEESRSVLKRIRSYFGIR